MLWVGEHGRIHKGQANRTLANGDLELGCEDFDALRTLLEEATEQQPGVDPIFSYSLSYGRERLTVQQYAGVIRTEHGTQIEILPKISRRADPYVARQLLVKMLLELTDSPFKEGTAADLAAHRMPLFEILLRQFLEHVGDIVRKGIARNYVDHADNLVFLRGKLQLMEHIRRNAADQSRVFCEFDEYEIDRPINRLIKGALEIVDRLTRDAVNQQRCREFLFWFDRVPSTHDAKADFRSVQRDRLIQHYEPAMPGCRLILEGLNPLTQQGERRAVSVLFPMNQVFENYVAAKLGRLLPGWQVRTQVSGQALVDEHLGRRIFSLIPDLELRRGDQRMIADTKWKLLDQRDRGNKYGISQADIYQLFAYSRKYLGIQRYRQVILIYPKTDTFDRPLHPFWYQADSEVLYVLPFDIEKDELVLDEALLEAGLTGVRVENLA